MYSQQQHQAQWSGKNFSGGQANKGSGRKGRLDHNILSYYRESLRHLEEARAAGSASEDSDLLLDTVFDSLSREGRQLSQNQTGSRIAESLVALADWPRLARLLANWSENWSAIVEDRFAHRVLQSAIRRWLVIRESRQHQQSELQPDPSQVWGHFVSHMRLHYPEYLEHTYACHALRSYLLLLAGVLVVAPGEVAPPDQRFQQRGGGGRHESYDPSCARLVDPPPEFDGISLTDELEQLASRFLENKHVMSLIDSQITGPFLQVLMLVLKLRLPKRFIKFYKYLSKESGLFDATCDVEAFGETYSVRSLFCNSRATYFLEQLLALLTAKQLRRFVVAHVSGREAALAAHPCANFVLQRCLDLCSTEDKYLAECAERAASSWLVPLMTRMPSRHQVVVRLVRQCRLLKGVAESAKAQSDLQSALFRYAEEISANRAADNATATTFLFECLAAIGSGESVGSGGVGEGDSFVSGVAGCMILYELFHYPNTKRLRASLLAMPTARLVAACRCPRANRTLEAFLASRTVPATCKQSVCEKLLTQISISDISCDKYGSRVMDAMWSHGSLELRERVAQKLAAGGQATFERLRRDRFGRFTFQRFAPELYARRRDDWRQLQERLDAQRPREEPEAESGLPPQAKRPKYEALVDQEDDGATGGTRISKKGRREHYKAQ